MTSPPPTTTAGAHRTAVWDALERARLCAYPLPPHGHHPNFTGAREAAKHLLKHPQVAPLHTLIVGPDRVLMPLRKLALQSGITLYVPNLKKDGWYWKLADAAGANLSKMAAHGEPKLKPEGAQAAVLACVAADRTGGRVGKGFGWGARGLHLDLPEFTLAHGLMLWGQLPCPADSHAALIGTPGGVFDTAQSSAPGPHGLH
ncbi:5-formyltetrahydrofolate cyclo-ligase [Deinococcus sp. Arct2-2]|uniref:5-formyltetrahydrofolate cyclo-ligase n=1 Tax=Deinococcus sp. Arct2-2 TaxID=2568653 RepID=UPI0010A32A07|nr:5-formyltetrahydrofolate cyclo-ligase [Deinococcus sp. Arct2-2]THF67644.1 5-formyltetrahydrofolate cyclo-ligase [Deinococcus sp. Arct2-2]